MTITGRVSWNYLAISVPSLRQCLNIIFAVSIPVICKKKKYLSAQCSSAYKHKKINCLTWRVRADSRALAATTCTLFLVMKSCAPSDSSLGGGTKSISKSDLKQSEKGQKRILEF